MSDIARGVYAAVLTPLDRDLNPDHAALARHARWLLGHGCDGLSVLGTTGEANSLTVEERIALLDALAAAGLPMGRVLPGTGCCALPDTIRLTRHALGLGVQGVLVLPPFYYKSVSDEGVYAAFARTIEGVGDPRLRLYLYHFPEMSAVPIPHAVIERLLAAYPGIVAGMKDSSGDFAHMAEVRRRFPGLALLSGSDEFLLPLLREGGAGCITALANIAAFLDAEICGHWRDERGEAARRQVSALRALIGGPGQIAALKEILARHTGDPAWRNIRPPLVPLDAAAAERLAAGLAALGFAPPPPD